MPLFYKAVDGWTADYVPFYWQGEYHLFYLKDYRDHSGRGEGTPWFHLGTRDFVSFSDYGESLLRGTPDEQDLYVFTGCVVEKDGLFHIYYTGHNPHLKAAGKPEQAVMHATSPDLMTWTKNPANPILFADPERYEMNDWRDPFVFWNEAAGEYWMLLAARLKEGPSNRRGCTALATSKDLQAWQIREPFWAPGLYYTHECPDLFRIGDWWYLVYSTFSERTVTHYRMSRSLDGPWLAPHNDALDGRAFYAAKTAGDGRRRFVFGWAPTRVDETDEGGWMWGGAGVVHEVTQETDGSLAVRVPPEIASVFSRARPSVPEPRIGHWDVTGDGVAAEAVDSFAWCRLGELPEHCALEVTVRFQEHTRSCGIVLRADATLDSYYQFRLEPGADRIVFDRWPRPGDQPFVLERPVTLEAGEPVHLRVLVEDTVFVAYVNDRVALTTRGYNLRGGDWGVFVGEGSAAFSGLELAEPASPPSAGE